MTPLYLTAEEAKLFNALSDKLREGWTVEPQELGTFESMRQLLIRFHLSEITKKYPAVQSMIDAIARGDTLDADPLQSLPPDIQQELYFLLGARGVHAIIGSLIQELQSDDDIEALAALTAIRRKLFEINSSAQYV